MPIFWTYYRLIIAAEEEFLREKFGDEFEIYTKKTRRFLPTFKAKWKGGDADFKAALRSERSTLYVISLWFLLILLVLVLK